MTTKGDQKEDGELVELFLVAACRVIQLRSKKK
jgi:hypothetical protein